jgi:YbbR domain-containing protein
LAQEKHIKASRLYLFISKKINRNSLIFGLFLLISAFLWTLNALNKTYTDHLSYPVVIKHLPKEYQTLKDLPSSLDLIIEGHGYNILSHKLNYSITPAIIDFENIKRHKISDKHYYILSKDIIDMTSRRLKGDIQVLSIHPDTIHIELTKYVSKKVPIVGDFSYKPARQYLITQSPEIVPDSVTISGPFQYLDSINFIKTNKYNFPDIKSNISRIVTLKKIENIQLKPDQVTVNIRAEKFTETSIKVPVQSFNLPDSLEMRCIPNQVELQFHVSISDFKQIDKNDFIVYTDFNDFTGVDKLPIRISNSPDYIQKLRIIPKEVSFILKQKGE